MNRVACPQTPNGRLTIKVRSRLPRSEPAVGQARLAGTTLLEIAFSISPRTNGLGMSQAVVSDGSDRHCNGPAPKRVLFMFTHSAFHSVWPNASAAPHKGTGALMAWTWFMCPD